MHLKDWLVVWGLTALSARNRLHCAIKKVEDVHFR